MMLEQAHGSFSEFDTPRACTPRLRLQPKLSRTGHVDGGWRPRSPDDLTAGLPNLIAVLLFRLSEIGHVTYNFSKMDFSARPAHHRGMPSRSPAGRSVVHRPSIQ
jgi:hypothetical protein